MLLDGSVQVEDSWCGGEAGDEHEASVGHEASDGFEGSVGNETTDEDEARGGYEMRCERLHRRLKRIVKARGALDAQEAEALREAERLRMWRRFGYASLLEYMEMEMGYSPRAALERLRVANAIVELPAIAEAMTQGDLSFSAARELTRVATPETEQEWIEAANDMNLRQVEALVSGHKPGDQPSDPVDPKLKKRRLRYDDIAEETVALLRQARQILERECGERFDDDQFLRALGRTVIDGGTSSPRTRAPYQIATVRCDHCKRAWQDGGGLTVEMSPAAFEVALCDAHDLGSVEAHGASNEPHTTLSEACGASNEPHTTLSEACGARNEPHTTLSEACGASNEPHTALSEPRGASNEPQTAFSEAHAASNEAHTTFNEPHKSSNEPHRAKNEPHEPTENEHGPGDERPACPRSAAESAPASAPNVPVRVPDPSPLARRKNTAGVRARSSIPPALRRKVNARDHGRCRVPWCRSSRNLDQHHLEAVCQGGKHTLANLITLCESHHIAYHEGSLLITGDANNATFTRRANSVFTIAQHAVETGAALRALGFKKHEVESAVDKTRAHVGTKALAIEQWIKIALSYCPRPCA